MRTGIHSLANACVLLVCVLLTITLLLPVVAQQRSQARASACAVNLKQIGLAVHNYHSAFKQLPAACGGTDYGEQPESSNQGRIGPLVALLPFVQQQKLWEVISNPYTNPETNQQFPRMGPVPWYDPQVYKPWGQGPSQYLCPDRPGDKPEVRQKIVYTLQSQDPGGGVMTNYVACYGDGTFNVGTPPKDSMESKRHARATKRGLFVPGQALKFRDCLDGLSNTLMFSETRSSVLSKPESAVAKDVAGLSRNPSLCLTATKDRQVNWWPFGRGSRWCDGELVITGFQTVLPPNSPSCTSDLGIHDAIASASSYHPGGVHVLFASGAVAFATDSIDCGDATSPGVSNAPGYGRPGDVSPFGVWGALGTRASNETIDALVGIERISVGRAASSLEFTRWTSRDGDVSLTAKLLRIIEKQTIELEDTRGVIHQVPLNTMSDRDIFRAVTSELEKAEKH